MKLLQRTIKKLKYLILIINYKLFPPKKNKGYNNLALNKSIVKKTIIYSKLKSINDHNINLQRTVKFLKFLKKKKLKKIIDFGGGAGYHFFVAKIVYPNLNLKWLIVENQIMVKLCNKKIKNKNLFFFDSFKQIKKADIFFSSCSINYTTNPIETIKTIIKLKPKYLYFTRTPLAENKSFKFKQISLLSENGPCQIKNEKEILVEYENKIITRQSFEEIFKNDFTIILKYIDEKNAFFFKDKSFNTYTYIIKRKKI
jgi:putative methyltransferase (TIGR04325 family)